MKKVAIIMGSDSDWPVVKGACTVLKDFGVPYEAHILSAHRTPFLMGLGGQLSYFKTACKIMLVQGTKI